MDSHELTSEVLSSELQDDLQVLAKLEKNTLESLAHEYATIVRVGLTSLTADIDWLPIETLLGKSAGLTKKESESVLKFCRYAFSIATSPKRRSTCKSLVQELASAFNLTDSQKLPLESFLEAVFSIADGGLRTLTLLRSTVEYGPPSFAGIGYVVDLRAVNENIFTSTEDDEAYAPHIVEYVPRGTISLKLTRHTPERVVFQASLDEVRLLIRHMKSLEKTMLACKQNDPSSQQAKS